MENFERTGKKSGKENKILQLPKFEIGLASKT